MPTCQPLRRHRLPSNLLSSSFPLTPSSRFFRALSLSVRPDSSSPSGLSSSLVLPGTPAPPSLGPEASSHPRYRTSANALSADLIASEKMYQDPYQQHVLFGIVQTPTRAQTITFPCQPPLSASSSYPLEPPASPRDARLAGLQYSTTLPINAPTRRPKRDSIGVGKEGGGGFGEGLEAKIVLLGSPGKFLSVLNRLMQS
jgi:hypothetical protein